MSSSAVNQSNRTPIYIALGLGILLVLGTLVGARVMMDRSSHEPVGMSAIDAPEADSAACKNFVEALPKKVNGHQRAPIAAPVPPGAAAYAKSSDDRVTVRCGVHTPFQLTDLAQTQESGGAQWLKLNDATEGSTLATWYAVDRSPVVAVTLEKESTPGDDLADALGKIDGPAPKRNPVPLTNLQSTAAVDKCRPFMDALPEHLGSVYERNRGVKLPQATAAWTAEGHDPVVVRCGVGDPAGYRAGERLQQVNDIPWFADTQVAEGTTVGTYYPMGRAANVAVSMPSNEGNAVLVDLTQTVSANLPPAPGKGK